MPRDLDNAPSIMFWWLVVATGAVVAMVIALAWLARARPHTVSGLRLDVGLSRAIAGTMLVFVEIG